MLCKATPDLTNRPDRDAFFPLVSGNSVLGYVTWLHASSADHLNSVPSTHMRCLRTASLRATATFAPRMPLLDLLGNLVRRSYHLVADQCGFSDSIHCETSKRASH